MVSLSPREGGCNQPFSYLPWGREWAGGGGMRTPPPMAGEQAAPAVLVVLGGLLPQLVSFGVAWVQLREGRQFLVLRSWCFSPSRNFQL